MTGVQTCALPILPPLGPTQPLLHSVPLAVHWRPFPENAHGAGSSSATTSANRGAGFTTQGVPTMIQNMISSISFMFLTGMVNTYGVAASAAVSVVNKLNSFAIMPPIAISNSVSSIAAQCFGAGDVHRAKKTFGIGLLLGWVLALPAFFLFKAIPVQLISLFDSDPEMIAAGLRYLTINLYDYLIVSFLFSTNGFINATGHTMFTAFNNILCSVIIRIPVAYVFGTVMGYGLMGVGAGTPCSTLIGTVIALAYYFIGSWKKGMIVQNQGEVDSGISEVGDPPVIE